MPCSGSEPEAQHRFLSSTYSLCRSGTAGEPPKETWDPPVMEPVRRSLLLYSSLLSTLGWLP